MKLAGLPGLASLLSYPNIGVTGVVPHVLLIIPKYKLCHIGLLGHSVIFRNVSLWGPGSVNFGCKWAKCTCTINWLVIDKVDAMKHRTAFLS